ncbi:MAG: ABC transporter permease [Polyangiaceae bacterium]|nr:ABC transporter permease [Polyangiaceae bacterium]
MRGLMIQLQVVHALIVRETMTRFGEHRLGYLWAFIEPSLWIGMFAGMYMLVGRNVLPGMGVISFLSTGLVPFLLFRNEASKNQAAVSSNRNLLFYPRIRPLDLVFSRSILEFATSFSVFSVLMAGAGLLEGRLHFDNPLLIMVGLMLAAGLGIGVGMIFCALGIFSSAFDRIMSPLMRPMFWISGLFFSVDSLPPKIRDVILYNPLAHAIALVRGGCVTAYSYPYISVWYPGLWALTLVFIGLTLERVVRRRIQLS